MTSDDLFVMFDECMIFHTLLLLHIVAFNCGLIVRILNFVTVLWVRYMFLVRAEQYHHDDIPIHFLFPVFTSACIVLVVLIVDSNLYLNGIR